MPKLHDNRHSLATDLLEDGRTLEEVGAILGHKNKSMTEKYGRIRPQTLRRVLRIAH